MPVSIWTYNVRSIIQLLLLLMFFFFPFSCFADSKHWCNCNSIRDGTLGSDFLHRSPSCMLFAGSASFFLSMIKHSSFLSCFNNLFFLLSTFWASAFNLQLECFPYGNYRDWSVKDSNCCSFALTKGCGNASPGGNLRKSVQNMEVVSDRGVWSF